MKRVGSKRPLGFLIAWLRDGHLWESHATHLEGRLIIKFEHRKDARSWAEKQPHLAELLEQEKKWCGAMGTVEEPVQIA